MQEKSNGVACDARRAANGVLDANASLVRSNVPPRFRRTVAASGGRAAIVRRSEIDRSCGLGKPRRVPCHNGDHVATVAPNLRWAATWLRHHAPCGVLGPRSGLLRPASSRSLRVRCLEASGVSMPAGMADAASTALDSTV
jgi:hypothetical protein